MSLISYDIDIDLKIINTIVMQKGETASMVQLRYNACGTTHKLENHLSNLERWGLIKDKKPTRNGMPRKISLNQHYGDCMSLLMKIKEAIETVNEYFD